MATVRWWLAFLPKTQKRPGCFREGESAARDTGPLCLGAQDAPPSSVGGDVAL